ncbi:MAG: hypothetical protein Q7J06_01575 [Bacteroidales bacterium]|nr:hypothetical protein [Bacteroidales bacterium]
MSPRGRYPQNSFQSEEAVFVSQYTIGRVYTLVKAQVADEQYHNSETAWALVSEIRLWASIALSIPEDSGVYILYPNPRPVVIKRNKAPFDKLTTQDFVDKMGRYLHEKEEGLNVESIAYESFSSVDFSSDIQEQLFQAIDCNNHVLIRGLSCLLKARLFMSKDLYLFIEEAALLVFFAVEALLSLVLESLRVSGISNPNFNQVFDIISKRYTPGVDVTDYFRDCYKKRIKLVHPDNKYEVLGIPKLDADDYFDTCTDMERIYRDYILDKAINSAG